jgi:hypothetical protein
MAVRAESWNRKSSVSRPLRFTTTKSATDDPDTSLADYMQVTIFRTAPRPGALSPR